MINLSIIVPNYNKAKYIDTLLSHLKEQMTDEVEVIVIDDASTDSSMEIISKYEDVFTIISNEENKYISYNRNVGLLHSKGKYVTFVDSDDDIVPDFIEAILERIKSNHDGYFFDYNIINIHKSGEIEKGYNTTVWSKVYRNKTISDNNIEFNVNKFPKGTLGEDLDFNLEFIRATNDIIKVDFPIINYSWGVIGSVHNSPQTGSAEPVYEVDDDFMNQWF